MKKRYYITLAFVSVVFILFIWPTMYRYDHITLRGNRIVVRINRVTGNAEGLFMGGWVEMKEDASTSNVPPESEQVQVPIEVPEAPAAPAEKPN